MWLVQALRSTWRLSALVQERGRFVRHQVARRRVLVPYRLAGTDLVVHLRHRTPDINTLEQAFAGGHYAVPQAVEDALRALGRPPVVLDLGANIGLFGADMLRRFPDAHVIGYEPDPENAEVHRRTVAANPGRRWDLVEAAAGAHDGTVGFATGRFTNSAIAADGDDGVVQVPLRDVFGDVGRADLLKVDIEGGEWSLVADPRFRTLPATAIAFEYHRPGCPEEDPRALATRALHEAGFHTTDAEVDTTPGHGTVWGWKTA